MNSSSSSSQLPGSSSLFGVFDSSHLLHLGLTSIGGVVIAHLLWHLFQGVFKHGNALIDAPIVGYTDTLRARWQFFSKAPTLVDEGYKKYKDQMFKLSGHDTVVMPRRYVDELKNIPEDKLNSTVANVENFQGFWTSVDVLNDGDLHTRMVQKRLTPRLKHHVPIVQDVMDRHFSRVLPATKDDSVSTSAFDVILRFVALIAARHFVGEPLCEDDEWLSTVLMYTDSCFRQIVLLRLFPAWLKPFVAIFSPYTYKIRWAQYKAQRKVIPMVLERRRLQAADPGCEKPEDFLQYMMDSADESDGKPHRLAHRLLVLMLAAMHTTSMAAVGALLDMCAYPEYIDPLRQEILDVVDASGGYTKQTLTEFKKLDSFMRESQRMNPHTLLAFKRAVQVPITLSDGTYLPKGANLAMPIYQILLDPDITPEPKRFDGMRQYHNRQRPGESTWHQFSTTSDENLHFGHGKYACPGRFMAGNSIKMILSNILIRCEFRFPNGLTERPKNLHMHEYVFPDPKVKVEFRLREHVPRWL